MHKWSMLNLAFQAGFIAGFFVAIFPYCAYGLPEWTCLPIIIVAPIAFCFIWPIFVHFFWMKDFCKALLFGNIKEFSADNHKWDGMYQLAKTAAAAEKARSPDLL